jgi:colanic acid biosynthesis glycosyl transferase WcaI
MESPGNPKLMKGRWLILTQYYAPEIGAPQIRLASFARNLKQRGIDVEVLTAMPNYPVGSIFPEYRGRIFMRDSVDGVPVRRVWLYPASGRSAVKRLLNYFSFTFTALFALFLAPRPALLFVESQPLSLGLVAVLNRFFRRVPYVYNVPDLQIEVARQLGFVTNKTFLTCAEKLETFFVRRAHSVSTVTHRFIDHFVGLGVRKDRVTFLPNGADSDFLRPLPRDAELAERWKLGDRKVILYVGTHAIYHGLETLVECADRLKDRSDIVFLLIGDGPVRQQIIRMAEERGLKNVVFGASPYGEMARLYSLATASVAVLRNIEVARQMRLSKIFPSLSCGVPVLYSGLGEAAEVLEANGCGIAVPPENPADLAEAVLRVTDDEELRREMGRRGRDLVEKEYSWNSIVGNWLDQLNAIDGHGGK